MYYLYSVLTKTKPNPIYNLLEISGTEKMLQTASNSDAIFSKRRSIIYKN